MQQPLYLVTPDNVVKSVVLQEPEILVKTLNFFNQHTRAELEVQVQVQVQVQTTTLPASDVGAELAAHSSFARRSAKHRLQGGTLSTHFFRNVTLIAILLPPL